MPDAFTTTIIFIVLVTFIGAFIRKRKRDKCLNDFKSDVVTLEMAGGKKIWGELNVENTGLEIVYSDNHINKNGPEKTSYILYKYEYNKMAVLIRYHDKLSEAGKIEREKELRKTYHPNLIQMYKRKSLNFFKTVRDSIMEVLNLVISQAKKVTPAGGMLTSQDKYVSQMKQELMGSVGTAYEPLLEKYIGHKVVLELIKADKIFEYCGVLKDYTSDFIEIMDVDYICDKQETSKKIDMVVSRKYAVIRHLGE